MQTIIIEWQKINLEEYLSKKEEHYGLYQIYSTHLIYGPQSLVYIGKAYDQPIHKRLKSHESYWLNDESEDVSVHIGRLIIDKNVSKNDLEKIWKEQVDDAEKLLIYNCAPAYNGSSIVDHRIDKSKEILLFNYGKRGQLPLELSTMYDYSIYWHKDNGGEGEKKGVYFEDIYTKK